MQKTNRKALLHLILFFLFISLQQPAFAKGKPKYQPYVKECLDNLIKYGTDRYGSVHAPILVSILDVHKRSCPENPEKLDEYFRVTRRERRNPAGSNLYTDQPVLRSMHFLSLKTGNRKYSDFAAGYTTYVMENLTDDKGFFWWGLHRHYDVFTDEMTGHQGNHHEIQAFTQIDWEHLWETDQAATAKLIHSIWEWHVIDKNTGEVNRHNDGKEGCDFSMSAGIYIEAFTFLYTKTNERNWLDRALFLANYYWQKRDPDTNLFPDRPNAGSDRFDGSCFVTSVTGLYCHSLLKAYELTGETTFSQQAVTCLKAYSKYGFDKASGKFFGALKLDGTPIPGPRVYTDNLDSQEGYAAAQPRGYLDLWEPYMAGYQYAIYTAQAYVYAYQLSGDTDLLQTAEHFAKWIANVTPGTIETKDTWYRKYSKNEGMQGTYAGKYGRTISFFAHLYVLTGNKKYNDLAHRYASMAIEKLFVNGMFKGHPTKPYYEAMDGVGYLLYALLQLDEISERPESVLLNKKIQTGPDKVLMPFDNW